MIGERLRAIREEKKFSQGDVEKRTGLLRCYVSRVENGHTVPSLETLEKWSKALEIPMYQLFYDGNKPAEPLVVKGNHAPKLNRTAMNCLRKVGAAFAKMQPRDMTILTHMARKFAEQR